MENRKYTSITFLAPADLAHEVWVAAAFLQTNRTIFMRKAARFYLDQLTQTGQLPILEKNFLNLNNGGLNERRR